MVSPPTGTPIRYALEGVCPPNVSDPGARIPVAALVHNPSEIGTALGSRGDIAGTQRVCTGEPECQQGPIALAGQDVGRASQQHLQHVYRRRRFLDRCDTDQ